MKVLVVTCSPRKHKSSAYNLAQTMVKKLSDLYTLDVEYIDANSIRYIDEAYAEAVNSEHLQIENRGSLCTSNRLITSLKLADMLIIATPLHNCFLPASLKNWIDHIIRPGKTYYVENGKKLPLLTDKPVYILISSGGWSLSDSALQSDLLSSYLKNILGVIGLKNISIFTLEGTGLNLDLLNENIKKLKRQICKHIVLAVPQWLLR